MKTTNETRDAWRTDVPTVERVLELLTRWREPWYWRGQWGHRERWNASSIRAAEALHKARSLESEGDDSAATQEAICVCRELAAELTAAAEPSHKEVLRYAAEWRELTAWLDAHAGTVDEVLPALDLADDRPDESRIDVAAMQVRRVERDVKRFVQAGHDATTATFAALVPRIQAFADLMVLLSPRRLHIRTIDLLQVELVGQVNAGHPDCEVIKKIIATLAQYRIWCGGGGHKQKRYELAPPTGDELWALCEMLE